MNAKVVYEQWKKAPLPEELADQLAELGQDDKWIVDAFGQDINFGTAGMRGLLEPGTNRINLFTVGRVTEGLARLIDENGEEAKKRGVVISFDSRYNSRELAMHAARVLGAHLKTPTASLLTRKRLKTSSALRLLQSRSCVPKALCN